MGAIGMGVGFKVNFLIRKKVKDGYCCSVKMYDWNNFFLNIFSLAMQIE